MLGNRRSGRWDISVCALSNLRYGESKYVHYLRKYEKSFMFPGYPVDLGAAGEGQVVRVLEVKDLNVGIPSG